MDPVAGVPTVSLTTADTKQEVLPMIKIPINWQSIPLVPNMSDLPTVNKIARMRTKRTDLNPSRISFCISYYV